LYSKADINISQGSVATHLRAGEYLMITVLQIYCWMCQWKDFEKRSIYNW